MFDSEKSFETHIRALIAKHVTSNYPSIYALENKKAVDIVICRDAPFQPALFFVEVKFHKKAHGRLGIGGGDGSGFQPEIIKKNPQYFETNLRWVIGNENDDKFIFVDSNLLRKFVSGGGVGNKFNSIRRSIFKDLPLMSESDFVEELQIWLTS